MEYHTLETAGLGLTKLIGRMALPGLGFGGVVLAVSLKVGDPLVAW